MRNAADGQNALVEALRAEGGSVAAALLQTPEPAPDAGAGPPQLASAGPRAAGAEHEYELLLEMIYEGSRLHYDVPRVFKADDPDLCLLLGDRLYAGGLARLAEIGDLEAVAELADVISLLAQAEAREDGQLAVAIWAAGARPIGWGAGADHAAAKAIARSEDPGATEALQSAAAATEA